MCDNGIFRPDMSRPTAKAGRLLLFLSVLSLPMLLIQCLSPLIDNVEQ